MVFPILMFYLPLVGCRQRGVPGRIHGQTIREHQQGMDSSHPTAHDELHSR